MSTEAPTVVNTIEVRSCANGFVVTVFYDQGQAYADATFGRGYESHVVESHKGERVGEKVAELLNKFPLSANVLIPPARKPQRRGERGA